MTTFPKLTEQHLKDLGFRMGDRVLLMEWSEGIRSGNTDTQQQSATVPPTVFSTSGATTSAVVMNQSAVSSQKYCFCIFDVCAKSTF